MRSVKLILLLAVLAGTTQAQVVIRGQSQLFTVTTACSTGGPNSTFTSALGDRARHTSSTISFSIPVSSGTSYLADHARLEILSTKADDDSLMVLLSALAGGDTSSTYVDTIYVKAVVGKTTSADFSPSLYGNVLLFPYEGRLSIANEDSGANGAFPYFGVVADTNIWTARLIVWNAQYNTQTSTITIGDYMLDSDTLATVATVSDTVPLGTRISSKQDSLVYAMRRQPFAYTDFYSAVNSAADPWSGAAISSGTVAWSAAALGSIDHPGTVTITSSTTANSGYRYQTSTRDVWIGGGEGFEAIFYVNKWDSGSFYIGYHDATTSTVPVDGVYFKMVAAATGSAVATGTVTGNTCSNSTNSATSAYTLTDSTWTRGRINVNADASAAYFRLYNMAGTLLWSDSTVANLPTGASRVTGSGFTFTHSGVLAIDMVMMDYMAIWSDRVLVR